MHYSEVEINQLSSNSFKQDLRQLQIDSYQIPQKVIFEMSLETGDQTIPSHLPIM